LCASNYTGRIEINLLVRETEFQKETITNRQESKQSFQEIVRMLSAMSSRDREER
jgi:hypothetical protein